MLGRGMRFFRETGLQPGEVLDKYLDGLYGYAIVLTHNRTEAEDLVQETCVRAIQAMGTLRENSNVKSWLFTILRNIWLNQLRHRRTVPETLELDPEENSPRFSTEADKDPHTLYVSKIESEQVRAAMEQLPIEFREVILLREFQDLSYQEIANFLGCPPGTVMSRLARARARLRVLLSTNQSKKSRETHSSSDEAGAFQQKVEPEFGT